MLALALEWGQARESATTGWTGVPIGDEVEADGAPRGVARATAARQSPARCSFSWMFVCTAVPAAAQPPVGALALDERQTAEAARDAARVAAACFRAHRLRRRQAFGPFGAAVFALAVGEGCALDKPWGVQVFLQTAARSSIINGSHY